MISLAVLYHFRRSIPVLSLRNTIEYEYVKYFGMKTDDTVFHNLPKPKLIMHAGGGYNGETYTNTLEALEYNYSQGQRFFELDFELTTDKIPVLIHDWNRMAGFNGGVPGRRYSLSDFRQLKRKDGLTQLDVESLAAWLKKRQDAVVITDVKTENLFVLSYIAVRYKELVPRFIPQIYRFKEYDDVRTMGYTDIILTLYGREYSDELTVSFSKSHKLYAVTMRSARILASDVAARLKQSDTDTYAHTVNDLKEYDELLRKGAYGIYTDSLSISQ